MAPKLTVHYFNGRGRAETTRWMLELAKVEYTDKRYAPEEWKAFKPSTPFGQMPILEIDGVMISQSYAMALWVAREYNMYGSNNLESAVIDMICGCIEDTIQAYFKAVSSKDEAQKAEGLKTFAETNLLKFVNFVGQKVTGQQYLVGNKLSLADVGVACLCDAMPEALLKVIDSNADTAALVNRVKELPEIAAWLKRRPETKF